MELEIKKLKADNERLSKSIETQKSKLGEKVVEEPKSDRKKEMDDKRQK
jgi:hypothetical protein